MKAFERRDLCSASCTENQDVGYVVQLQSADLVAHVRRVLLHELMLASAMSLPLNRWLGLVV